MFFANNILKLIPQRPPFVFVDSLSGEENSNQFQSELLIKFDNPLLEGDFLAEAGIVEFVAQSMAAHIGYFGGDEVKIGVIGSIKKLSVSKLPKIGDTIVAELVITNKVFNITLVEAKVFCKEKEIAFCEMKVAVPD